MRRTHSSWSTFQFPHTRETYENLEYRPGKDSFNSRTHGKHREERGDYDVETVSIPAHTGNISGLPFRSRHTVSIPAHTGNIEYSMFTSPRFISIPAHTGNIITVGCMKETTSFQFPHTRETYRYNPMYILGAFQFPHTRETSRQTAPRFQRTSFNSRTHGKHHGFSESREHLCFNSRTHGKHHLVVVD